VPPLQAVKLSVTQINNERQWRSGNFPSNLRLQAALQLSKTFLYIKEM
jgi:hypothetical protein